MSQKSFLVPGILIVASAGLVVGMYLVTGSGGKAVPEPVAAPTAGLLARDGVRPADQDSARRGELDVDDEPADPPTPIELPEVRPLSDEELERQRPQPPPEPAPPVILSEEEQAAQDAFFALREQVAEDVQRQLGKQGSALKKACWKPELTGGASSASFSLNASFNPAGVLVASGISDNREGGGSSGVGQCLRQQALALKVPPSLHAITVDVPLRLP